ncbi:MAG TPA: hypothetical protein VFO49_13165 [Nocardioides sp.]|nr:hypothetical protein [Nocardioides sp.]
MTLVSLVVWVVEQAPEDEDVVAGWTAFAIFGLLIAAVIFLGFSLTKQLRKVDQAEAAGLYDPSDRKKPSKAEPAEDAGEE